LGLLLLGVCIWRLWPTISGKKDSSEEEQDDRKETKGPDRPGDKRPSDKERPDDKRPGDKERPDDKPDPVVLPPREPPPFKDRLPWQPAELVQVLGDERGRHWGNIDRLDWRGARIVSSSH